MKRRLSSLVLTVFLLTLCVAGLSVAAQAAEPYGDFIVATEGEGDCSYDEANRQLILKQPGSYTVAMAQFGTTTQDTIVVDAQDVILTLDNVQIASEQNAQAALTLNQDCSLLAVGTVKLTGAEGKTQEVSPAISGSGKTLTFLGGELYAQGGKGEDYEDANGNAGIEANVVMQDGTLYATGGAGSNENNDIGGVGAAGISGKTVTVNGGMLMATGGDGGEGACGGNGASGIVIAAGGTMTVTGGNVTATGGTGGGVSYHNIDYDGGDGGHGISIGDNATLTVAGGNVTANGGEGDRESPIDGKSGNGIYGTVEIDRGIVTAAGGYDKAAFDKKPTIPQTNRQTTIWESDTPYVRYTVLAICPITYEGIEDARFDSDKPTSHIEGTDTVVPDPTKPDYRFDGWLVNDTGNPVKNLTLAAGGYTEPITLTATWTAKETYPLTLEPQRYSYDAGDWAYTLPDTVTGVTVEYRLDGTWTEEAPTNAGRYDVRFTRAEDETYKSCDVTLPAGLVIERINPQVTPPTVKTPLVYTGQPIELLTAGSTTGGTLQYSFDGVEWSETVPTAVEAGGYQLLWRVVGNVNYNDIMAHALSSVTIAKATPQVTAPVAKTGLVYTGQPLELVTAGSTSAGTLWYRLEDGQWNESVPTAVKPGSYTVYYRVAGNSNYDDLAEKAMTVEIKTVEQACPRDGACPMASYQDVEVTKWYHDGVHFCLERGLMNGTSDTTFFPHNATNRAMLATILWRMEGEPEVAADTDFTDIADGDWYTKAVAWAQDTGVVEGFTDNTFRPMGDLTREQAATMLYRYAVYKDCDTRSAASLELFPDGDEVSSYAEDALAWACAVGVIEGRANGSLDPRGDAQRCETAAMLMRFDMTIVNP